MDEVYKSGFLDPRRLRYTARYAKDVSRPYILDILAKAKEAPKVFHTGARQQIENLSKARAKMYADARKAWKTDIGGRPEYGYSRNPWWARQEQLADLYGERQLRREAGSAKKQKDAKYKKWKKSVSFIIAIFAF